MLILTRKKDESIIINGNIEIQIISIEEGKVKIGIEAPKEIEIFRNEVFEKIQTANQEAANNMTGIKILSDKMKALKKENK
jgi:carbon storage regulator